MKKRKLQLSVAFSLKDELLAKL